MVNKSIRQNWKIFNNLKFYPLGEVEETVPKTKEEAALWAERLWDHICNNDLQRNVIFVKRGVGTNKWTISVWSDTQYTYLIQVLRTEYNTDSTIVYIKNKTEDNVNDFIALAKFVHQNVSDITGHSIKGIKELNKLVTLKMEKADGEA